MKEFNYKLAKKGYRVITRDGRKVEIVTVVPRRFRKKLPIEFPITALVYNKDGTMVYHVFTLNGKFLDNSGYEHHLDLFMDE